MSLTSALQTSRLSWVLFGSILISWALAAVALDQPVLAVQHSKRLLELGAVNGDLLEAGEWWRLVVSQFLHSRAPHMMLNALAVLLTAALIESTAGRWWLLAIYFVGGCVGQYASVAFYPAMASSGASQALMSLCGAALLICRSRISYLVVVPVLAVQLTLDLWAAGTVKAGHGWGLAAGILLGSVAVMVSRRRAAVVK